MGAFTEQIQKANAIQQQALTIKQMEQLKKVERQKEIERQRRQKQAETDALFELDAVFNGIFSKTTNGEIANKTLTASQCNYILQQLEHREGIIKDVSKGKNAIYYFIDKHYDAALQKVYKKYLQDEKAKKELQEINKTPSQNNNNNSNSNNNKEKIAYQIGVLLKYFVAGITGIITILVASIIGIFWGLFDISKK